MARRSVSRLPRLPLPAKLFLSYLLVLVVGAVPTFVYVRAELERELVEQATDRLTELVGRSARALADVGPAARADRLREMATLLPDRLTLIADDGAVLFDTTGLALENHGRRPEVKDARAGANEGVVGVARRLSETTNQETIYVAAVVNPVEPHPMVVRISRSAEAMLASTGGLTRFARNTQAVAVTVALLLSLLAAFFFLRPLQRVVQTAQALAQGDLAARTGLATDDEVGEAGRAIDAMAVDLRRRLANAGSGDAVLAQLVGALPLPCLVFDVSGEILAQNANGRRALLLDGPRSSRRIRELIAAPAWQSAVDAAERDGEPFPVSVLLDDGHRVDGHVHLLKRPGASPLILLVSTNTIQETTTSLPGPETVRPVPLSEVLDSARARLNGELAGVTLEIGASPAVLVAEADGRVVKAVARVLSSCARAAGGAGNTLCINVTVEETRVGLSLLAPASPQAALDVQPLLQPLGGSLVQEAGEAHLWLPRA